MDGKREVRGALLARVLLLIATGFANWFMGGGLVIYASW